MTSFDRAATWITSRRWIQIILLGMSDGLKQLLARTKALLGQDEAVAQKRAS
jgi:hypothetical protein